LTRNLTTGFMGAVLNQDERLMKMLIPDFPVGCRRITPGITYLKALTQPNVQVNNKGIQEVCPEGIKLTSGELIELDAIVCATGFDVSFVPRFPMIGELGNLQDIWKKELPAAYMSCMVPGMPNYFSKSDSLSITVCVANPNPSFPRSQRPNRPRQRPHHCRTPRKIHYESHSLGIAFSSAVIGWHSPGLALACLLQ